MAPRRRRKAPQRPAEVRLGWLPSRWDRDRASLESAVREAVESEDLVGLTEVNENNRAKALRGWAGWSVLRGNPAESNNAGEVALMVRTEVWEVLEWAAAEVGPDLGPGGATVAIVAAVRHRPTGEVGIITLSHLPASVEGAWSSARARDYREAVQRWRRVTLEWRRTYRATFVIAVADWNLNLFRPWVRAYVRSAWPGLRVAYRLPRRGTHAGRRLIDFVLTRGLAFVRLRVLPPHPHSDHNRVRVRGWFRRQKGTS